MTAFIRPDDEAVVFENVRFCYGEIRALEGVSFSLRKNGLTVFVGPNGGGKSTLLKLMAGLIKPESGTVRKGAGVGYVPQLAGFDTSFPLTVQGLVLMGTLGSKIRPFSMDGRGGARRKEAAAEAIRKAGLEGLENRGIGELSGGQLKRAVIARVLASDAGIIALDEPDASLDADASSQLYALLGELKKEHTVALVSHNVNRALDIADRAVYINGFARVYERPSELKSRLEGGMLL